MRDSQPVGRSEAGMIENEIPKVEAAQIIEKPKQTNCGYCGAEIDSSRIACYLCGTKHAEEVRLA